MRRLIIADVHANLPALESVLTKAGKCDEVVFLGDLANFGPHPSECVNLMREINATCIMGNHDQLIAFENEKRNFWDEWSRKQLNDDQLLYLQNFQHNLTIEKRIFALHGSYTEDYDILPNTPSQQIEDAFSTYLPMDTKMVLFGHYHYQIDTSVNGIEYHCIRPVGHHRDKDNRASFALLEDGKLTHHRVEYDIDKTIFDIKKIDCFDANGVLTWQNFLKNAYDEKLLEKDIKQMKKNEQFIARRKKNV